VARRRAEARKDLKDPRDLKDVKDNNLDVLYVL